MNPFLGEIRTFGFNFAPVGWAMCNGQTLPISQYQALFALVGTFYGGNGTTNFQLPNLQSRVAIHMGQGQGLSPYVIGQIGGSEAVTLNQSTMPQHTHTLSAGTAKASAQIPAANALLGHSDDKTGNSTPAIYLPAGTSTTTVNLAGVGLTGNNLPFGIIQPYCTLNLCIAMNGIFPSRN